MTDPTSPTAARPSASGPTDRAICIGLFLATLAVYLRTLCPTIFTDDCGEITTAVATGGVIHPPGYPLYAIIGSALIRLIHLGEPAWRLGLVSSLAASGAVCAAYLLARRAGAAAAWAATAALAFGFSLALWQQATKVETYSLNALFVGLILLSAERYERTGARRDLRIAALTCGLALTNHLTIVCAIAGALWLVGRSLSHDSRPLSASAQALAAFCAPLSLYGLVWLAAAHHPGGQVWGDPSSLRRFILHVSGARYRVYLHSQTGGQVAERDLIGLPATLWNNMGWFLIGVVPGVARGLWFPGARRLIQAMLITGAAYLIETSAYGIPNIFEYYTPLVMLLCVWAGVGMDGVASGLMRKLNAPRASLRTVQLACSLLIVGPALLFHWSSCDRSDATFIRDLALNTLKTMPPNATVIALGDNRNFPIWYAQDVLGVRRDVLVVSRAAMASLATPDGRDEMGWLPRKMQAQHPDVVDAGAILAKCASDSAFARQEGATWQIAARSLNLGRPVLLTDILPSDTHSGPALQEMLTPLGPSLALTPVGLASRIVPVSQLPNLRRRLAANLAAESQMRIAAAPDALMNEEPDGNVTNIFYSNMLRRTAQMLQRAGDAADAYKQYEAAVALVPSAENEDELGVFCSQNGHAAEAVDALQQAVALGRNRPEYQEHLREAQRLTALSHTPLARNTL